MQDGAINQLSIEPGIYPIKGGNGSGKSTLMNMILGYERGTHDFNSINVSSFIENIRQEQLRVIDRESIIFECIADFNGQICGPVRVKERWQKTIYYALSQLLSAEVAKEWRRAFLSLETEYSTRQDKKMSSGERVILSLMRFFSSWKREVSVLIIDECDAFLDHKKKKLFMMTVKELSRFMAVYISCHDGLFLPEGNPYKS